jgi:hypothetical protein
MPTTAVKIDSVHRAPSSAVEARVERAKLRAFIAWFFASPKLPACAPIDYPRETAPARAARLLRIQDQVDDLMVPLTPADVAGRWLP